jgi:hypothetical protein
MLDTLTIAPALDHAARTHLADDRGGANVHGHGLVERFDLHIEERLQTRNACVAHEQIDRLCGDGRGARRRCVGEIDSVRLATDRLLERAQVVRRAAQRHDARATGREQQGRRPPDAFARARHQRTLAGEFIRTIESSR